MIKQHKHSVYNKLNKVDFYKYSTQASEKQWEEQDSSDTSMTTFHLGVLLLAEWTAAARRRIITKLRRAQRLDRRPLTNPLREASMRRA